MSSVALPLVAAGRIGAALAVGLAAIGAVEAGRGRLPALRTSVLFLRWRTWALAAPLFLAAVTWRWACVVFVSALALQGVREFARLVDLQGWPRRLLLAAAVGTPVLAALDFTMWRAMPPLLLLVATLPALLSQDCERGATRLAYAGLGFAYIPWLLTYVLLLRENTVGGAGVLLAIGVAVAASDIFAYVVGRMVPSPKLAPKLSPNKTLAGVGGNAIGALAGLSLMHVAKPAALPDVLYFSLAVVVVVGCVWGDLLESLIKRQFGVKDTGAWLPGFGGLLDRIDSLLVVAPLAYTVQIVGMSLVGAVNGGAP